MVDLWMQTRADLAACFQRSAITHLTQRCQRAVAWAKESHPQVQTMVVAGGVACNQMLRDSLEEVTQEADWQLVCPKPSLCTDNGVMVAWAGVERSASCSSQQLPFLATVAFPAWLSWSLPMLCYIHL